jgi:hypothetical protein
MMPNRDKPAYVDLQGKIVCIETGGNRHYGIYQGRDQHGDHKLSPFLDGTQSPYDLLNPETRYVPGTMLTAINPVDEATYERIGKAHPYTALIGTQVNVRATESVTGTLEELTNNYVTINTDGNRVTLNFPSIQQLLMFPALPQARTKKPATRSKKAPLQEG